MCVSFGGGKQYLLLPTPPTFLETENCHHHVLSVRSKLNTVSRKQISLFKQSSGRTGQECDCGDSRKTGGNNDVCACGVEGEWRKHDVHHCEMIYRKCLKNNDRYSQTFLFYFHLSWSGRLYLAFVSICKDVITSFIYTECIYNNFLVCTAKLTFLYSCVVCPFCNIVWSLILVILFGGC